MKSIMASVKPEDCELIANNKKFTILFKTKPKLKTPFKCYIYCTGGPGKKITFDNFLTLQRWNGIRLIKRHIDKGWLKDSPEQTWQVLLDYGFTHPIIRGDYELNGKVIGEFICDKIDAYPYDEHIGYPTPAYDGDDSFCDCGPGYWVTGKELNKINLTYEEFEAYGNKKDLYGWNITEFKIYDKPKKLSDFATLKKCTSCKQSGYESNGCIYDETCKVPATITNLPKPWYYIEENI